MSGKQFYLVILCLFTLSFGYSQKGVTTFGLQYKPIIPNKFIGTYKQDFNQGQLVSNVQQQLGHCFGGVVRYGLTDIISFETGLNLTHRNFGLNFAVPDSGYAETGTVGVVSYEVPLSCLIYIRLTERWYINTSLGSALNMFSSNVSKQLPISGPEYFKQEGAYRSKIQGALLANVGFEFRTRDKGYFYIGSSYNLPFSPIITFAMSYEYPGGKTLSIQNIRGSYLTLDFRYFFNEKPEKRN